MVKIRQEIGGQKVAVVSRKADSEQCGVQDIYQKCP